MCFNPLTAKGLEEASLAASPLMRPGFQQRAAPAGCTFLFQNNASDSCTELERGRGLWSRKWEGDEFPHILSSFGVMAYWGLGYFLILSTEYWRDKIGWWGLSSFPYQRTLRKRVITFATRFVWDGDFFSVVCENAGFI
jgi:hypothetical protein